jgi:hypothetical protein
MRTRLAVGGLVIALALAACGSDRLSLPDYVDELNAVIEEGSDQIEPLYIGLLSAGEPTLEGMRSVLDQEVAIRVEIQEDFAELKAPDQIAELHNALVDWHGQMIEAQKLLGSRANSATTWSEFEQSEEFRDFDAVMEEGLAGCLEFQAQLDATEARGVFSDTPWIPGELKEVVDAALGCDTPLGE